MTAPAATPWVRPLAVTRVVAGAALLAAPQVAARLAASNDSPPPPRWIVRVLGVRLAGQGALECIRPTRSVSLAGGAVDAVHVASMLATSATKPEHERACLVSAWSALLWAAASTVAARRASA